MTKADTLTEKQQQAIQLLLVGQTDQRAAEAVGVTRQTVNQWKNQDPGFMARMNQEKGELWQSYCQRLRSTVGLAIEVLIDDLTNQFHQLNHQLTRQLTNQLMGQLMI